MKKAAGNTRLDTQWLMLMKEAKMIGLTKDDVRRFFVEAQQNKEK